MEPFGTVSGTELLLRQIDEDIREDLRGVARVCIAAGVEDRLREFFEARMTAAEVERQLILEVKLSGSELNLRAVGRRSRGEA